MTGPGTNTYLLGEQQLTVLDPGPDDPQHMNAILSAAGGVPIRFILVTHTHRDHSPLAQRLAAASGARVIGMLAPNDGRQDESFLPAQVPGDGERLLLGDCELIAIHTPGHASNCVCYLSPRERLLFTGDHILEGVSPVILPPDGDMSAYIESLDKLMSLQFDRMAPGHGDVIVDAKQAIRELRAHRMAREYKVLSKLRNWPPSRQALREAGIADLTREVYDDVPVERHAWAQLTLQAHLIKLAREELVVERDGCWRAA